MQLICGSETFHAHKLIVCSRSSFFHNAFCKAGMEEQRTGTMKLADKDSDVVKAMLEFLYTRNYNTLDCQSAMDLAAKDVAPVAKADAEDTATAHQANAQGESESLDLVNDPNGDLLVSAFVTFNIKIFALATEYFIDDLKQFTYAKLKRFVDINVPSNVDLCKAVLTVHKMIPEEEESMYDLMSLTVARSLRRLKDTRVIGYLVTHCPGFLLDVAVKAGGLQADGSFNPLWHLADRDGTSSKWKCTDCESERHSKKCMDCNKIDYRCGRNGTGARGRGGHAGRQAGDDGW